MYAASVQLAVGETVIEGYNRGMWFGADAL